ncbi:MAG TPA: DUF4062 domain-containing protein [Longimicrobium sp.]|nr:DUF4062 domain-containing protein [Longimicrobium sp.]
MAKVYISSTYTDLKEYREQVCRALRRLGHEVIAMEEYVARDERPVDRCLSDVKRCDVYVGIFAWRYGYVPPDDEGRNPDGRSITELEYRAARDAGKDCLIFLMKPEFPWPRTLEEKGLGGDRLEKLRDELETRHSRDQFTTPDDLSTQVVTAMAAWAPPADRSAPLPPRVPTHSPHFREVGHHVYLVSAPIDERTAAEIASRLPAAGTTVIHSTAALFADSDADFLELERGVRQCHTAAVVVSDAMLDQLNTRAESTRSVLRILAHRTGRLVALCTSESSLQRASRWEFTESLKLGSSADVDPSRANGAGVQVDSATVRAVERALFPDLPRASGRAIGLPFMVLAMTEKEARELEEDPRVIAEHLGGRSFEQFQQLKEALQQGSSPAFAARYGPARHCWKPFAGSNLSVRMVMDEVIKGLNQRQLPQLGERRIKAQYYCFDSLVGRSDGNRESTLLRHIYDEIGRTGCVVLVDEISLFHPSLRRAFVGSSLANQEQVALVTISPFDPTPNQMLESELQEHLTWAFNRFAFDYDPQREFGVGDERRLKRWLHSSLPQTLRSLRERRPDQQAIAMFRDEIAPAGTRSSMADFMYSQGGVI